MRMVLKPLPPPAPLRSCDIWEAATKGDDASISRLVEQGVQVDATDDVSHHRLHAHPPLTSASTSAFAACGWC